MFHVCLLRFFFCLFLLIRYATVSFFVLAKAKAKPRVEMKHGQKSKGGNRKWWRGVKEAKDHHGNVASAPKRVV